MRLLWHPQAQFAGLHVADHERLGATRGVEFALSGVDFARGPIDALLAGDADFAVASPSHLLESPRADELVLLLAIQQASALVYPARLDRGIAHARDLAGRRVGVWPGGEHLELRWMLKRAGVDPDGIDWRPMADTIGPFLAGEVDCAQATVYHELRHVLAHAGGTSRVVLLRAADVDAALIKDGFVTTRRLLDERPDLVDAVVEAALAGWTIAFAEPARGVEACLAADPRLRRTDQVDQLEAIRELAHGRLAPASGLGWPDVLHVERAARALRELGHPVDDAILRRCVDAGPWRRACARLGAAE